MKSVAPTAPKVAANPDKIIWVMPLPGIASRLVSALTDTASELSAGFTAYLRNALLPEMSRNWFPIRLALLVGSSLAHPIDTLRGAAAADELDLKRRRRFIPILTISAGIHGVLVVYLVYLAFFSQFANLQVVNKAYKKFDPNTILAKLYYPPQMLRGAPQGPAMTLEEIRARAEKKKHELALAREKAEKIRKEKEEADRKAAEEAAKVAAEKKPATEQPKLSE